MHGLDVLVVQNRIKARIKRWQCVDTFIRRNYVPFAFLPCPFIGSHLTYNSSHLVFPLDVCSVSATTLKSVTKLVTIVTGAKDDGSCPKLFAPLTIHVHTINLTTFCCYCSPLPSSLQISQTFQRELSTYTSAPFSDAIQT